MENNEPINPTWWSIIIKFIAWLIIWALSSAMVLLAVFWLSKQLDHIAHNAAITPLVWLSFMWIALITSIIGSIIISIIYNVLWPDDYYDIKLMTSWILVSNLLVFVIFIVFYIYAWSILSNINYLFVVYGFHLFFSLYVSFVIIDILKNPNYSPVYVIWNSFGFIFSLLVFFMIYAWYSSSWQKITNVLFYPPILSFSLIPVFASLWEKLYYKFYEMGNDFLYVPSLSEVMVDEEEVDEVNVNL